MKKKNFKTRIIAIAMATISMLSSGSIFSVSAAETTPQTSTAIAAESNTSNTANTSKARFSLRNYLYNEIDHSKVNLTKRFENQQNIRLYNHENGTLIVANPKQKTLDKSNDDFSAINQIKSVTYPGSLIKINEQFVNGTPTKINAN